MRLVASVVIRVVALFHLYGAAVHVFNMLGLSGFDWRAAPLKWQALDVVYLAIDVVVVVGLFLGWKVGFVAFFLAASTQIVLYTIFRAWITDVSAEFALSGDQRNYLTLLVIFHLVTIVLVTWAMRVRIQAAD